MTTPPRRGLPTTSGDGLQPDGRTSGLDAASRPFVDAIAPKYTITRLIGRGGMGVVYLARDRRLDRLVAIKTLPPQLAADPGVRERFFRETRAAGAMSHPNIIPLHGADEVDGHLFSVMAYVDGASLASVIRSQGRMEPAAVLGILRDVAAGLAHAHARGVIHRDIKAENILIDRETSRALVTDFGIARLAEAGPLTATGQLLGTVYYVSPEQVSGEPIDARSDLYALGVVGFLALTGTFPFDGLLASAVLIAHVNKLPPAVRAVRADVPPALAAIVDRCLAKDPARRYSDADDLLAALARIDLGHVRANAPASKRLHLVAESEAHDIWGRAAELQASTAEQRRPEPSPAPRDANADAAVTTGYAVHDVREAGREAGFATGVIDRAMAEHGLTLLPVHQESSSPPSGVIRAGTDRPSQLVFEHTADGELVMTNADRLVRLLTDATGRTGETTWFPAALLWRSSGALYRLEATVVPAAGQTLVRLQLDLRDRWVLLFAALVFVLLVWVEQAAGPLSAGVLTTLLTGAGVAGLAVLAMRYIRRRATGWLRVLGEAILGNVRGAIHGA